MNYGFDRIGKCIKILAKPMDHPGVGADGFIKKILFISKNFVL
jgi:hypothetical protein